VQISARVWTRDDFRHFGDIDLAHSPEVQMVLLEFPRKTDAEGDPNLRQRELHDIPGVASWWKA